MISKAEKEKRKKILLANSPVDKIYDEYHCKDFSDFTCSAGGDVLTYRMVGSNNDYCLCVK